MRFWYRGWVWIRRISSLVVFLWALLRTPTERPSPAARLPQEIVEMVISYLACDIPSLRASSETCRSWYISAFPHLHTTFSINVGSLDPHRAWPKPILRIYRLCLLSYVKNLRICSGHLGGDFHPQPLPGIRLLSHRTMGNFKMASPTRYIARRESGGSLAAP